MVQWRRRLDDSQENDGSIPSGITAKVGQVCNLSRGSVDRLQTCPTKTRSVGVPEAHLRGREGDRVRFPDGPLDRWAARSMEGRLVCTQVIGVRLPGGPLNTTGPWSNGKTPVRQTGNPGSIPGGVTRQDDFIRNLLKGLV